MREESVHGTRLRRCMCQSTPQKRQLGRYVEGVLEAKRLVAACSSGSAFEQSAGHVDQQRFLFSGSFEDAASSLAAIHGVAAGGKVQVAEKHVIAGAPKVCEGLLRGCGAVHS